MQSKLTRRSALRKLGAAGVGIVGATSIVEKTAPIDVASASDPKSTWTKSDQDAPDTSTQTWDVYQSATTGWYGATWEGSSQGGWKHDFRIQTDCRTDDDDGNPLDWLEYQSLALTQGTTDNFTISHHDKYHGVYPSPSDDYDSYDHEDLIIDIAKAAISELNTIASFAFTAVEIADKLIPDENPQDSSYMWKDYWDYAGDPKSDAGAYRWIYPYTKNDESVFDIILEAGDPDIGAETRVQFTFHIKSDYTPREGKWNTFSSVSSQKTTAGTTIASPKDGWVVEKIPHKKIEARGQALGIDPNTIHDHLARPDKPMFYAHRMPISVE